MNEVRTKVEGPKNSAFQWQAEYAAFSVSQSNVPQVKHYIENQEEHHRKMTFHYELKTLFQRHEIALAERFEWD